MEARLHPGIDLHPHLRLAGQAAALAPNFLLGSDCTVPFVRPPHRSDRRRRQEPAVATARRAAELDWPDADALHPCSAAGVAEAAGAVPLHVVLRTLPVLAQPLGPLHRQEPLVGDA